MNSPLRIPYVNRTTKQILVLLEVLLIKKTLFDKANPIKILFANLQGQDVDFHFFIALLNSQRLSNSFISSGASSQILRPKI